MTIHKKLLVFVFAWFALNVFHAVAQQPKYVIYLILDGVGVNTVLGTEMMAYEVANDHFGRVPTCMTSLPVVGLSSTHSANSGITDSAASGTALATGIKTFNGAIGVGVDTLPLATLAERAKAKGLPVGIATSVCVNHATPASQYAHTASRGHYFDIAMQIPATGYDFFGGSDVNLERAKRSDLYRDSVYAACRAAGYVTARGTYADYEAKRDAGAHRMLFFQDLDRTLNVDAHSLPYAIDAQPGQLSVADIMRAELDFLYRRSEAQGGRGFFLMNEVGGKVDFACHANDGATAFREVQLADSCVRMAYDFYLAHPDETLIVVTADHETGGLTLGCEAGHYKHRLRLLAGQTCSLDGLTAKMQNLRTQTHNLVTWEAVSQLLTESLGFWTTCPLDAKDEARLRKTYESSFVGKMPTKDNLYSRNEPLAAEAVEILNEKACLGWTTSGHTAGLVPVYACGVGAEAFMGHNDNAQIAQIIARLAGYE